MAEENAEKKEKPDITIDTALPPEENAEALSAKNDGKSLLILTGIVIGLFVLLFAGFRAYNSFTSASVVSIDDLHQQNLAGELDEDYEGYIYNGYSFVKVDGLWWTEMNKFGTLYKAPLHFAPRELENLIIGGTLDDTFNQGDEVYVTIDPTVQDKYYTLAVSELSFNIVQGMDRTPIGSCTEEDEACDNRTIISCETANGKPTIELGVGPEPEITLQGSCIKIRGTEYGIVKAVDRLLYQWFGIMD
ncbi:MAG TPA: hypothetical protein VJC21_03450 [Candidatus Nanoarchaeia archaeon]|nr:hypothetical protein [Candidatus Nanoarchaeia archaeon]